MLPEYESFMKSGADTTCSAAGYSMEEALSKITYAAERGAVIALLDTCRSNAAAACGGRTRGLGAACPKMDLEIAHPETTELLECFACSHENEAQDGSSGSNGLYTKHLLQVSITVTVGTADSNLTGSLAAQRVPCTEQWLLALQMNKAKNWYSLLIELLAMR